MLSVEYVLQPECGHLNFKCQGTCYPIFLEVPKGKRLERGKDLVAGRDWLKTIQKTEFKAWGNGSIFLRVHRVLHPWHSSPQAHSHGERETWDSLRHGRSE